MYYHIHCQLRADAASKRGDKDYFEKDIPDEEMLKNKFVIPYLKGVKFRLGGGQFASNELNKFLIYRTLEPIQNYVVGIAEYALYNYTYENLMLEDTSALENITTSILDECEQMIPHNESEPKAEPQKLSRDIFIVHGHEESAITEVKEFLRKLQFKPIVLREQPNEGRTIIEKLIDRTQPNEIGYGIVLYTPSDRGYADGHEADAKARARQNVVFEHGLLMGSLGRNRVHPLVKGEIETPGDLGGVVYTDMDGAGAWHMKIIKELKALGFEVDANLLIEN